MANISVITAEILDQSGKQSLTTNLADKNIDQSDKSSLILTPVIDISKEEKKYSLLNGRVSYKPFDYPWAFDAWQAQQRMHWIPEEVTMSDDVNDWLYKLTPSEKNLCTQIFRFFTQADIEVQDCYMTRYAGIFKPVEVKMMLAAFSNMETIHIAAYSYLIETMKMPDTLYQEFLDYKAMKDKYDYMHSFNMESKEDIAFTLAAFGAFTEGVQLFASFAILLNFQRFGKMRGMGQIITWSVRDESLHVDSITQLFRTFISENKHLWTKALRDRIYDICHTIVGFEDAFIDLAFEINNEVEGLKAVEVKQYIRYIADSRLRQLGLKPVFLIDRNPLPWIPIMLNSQEHTNFFENRSTEYSRASTKGNWDDAFSMHTASLPGLNEDKVIS